MHLFLFFSEKRICHLLRAMEENLLAWPVRKPEDYLPPKSANKVRQNPEQPMESKPHPGEYILTHFILKTNWLITVFSSSCLLIASFFGLNPFFIKNPPGVRLLPHKGEQIPKPIHIGAYLYAYKPSSNGCRCNLSDFLYRFFLDYLTINIFNIKTILINKKIISLNDK